MAEWLDFTAEYMYGFQTLMKHFVKQELVKGITSLKPTKLDVADEKNLVHTKRL